MLEPGQSLFLLFSNSYAHDKIISFYKDTSPIHLYGLIINGTFILILHTAGTCRTYNRKWACKAGTTGMNDPAIKYYSGTAVYRNSFHWEKQESRRHGIVGYSFDSHI